MLSSGGNESLVFEPGNQYEALPPYFTMPAWWRRFIFRVLTARDFAVYSYLVSLTDRYGIAYPTQDKIAFDLGLDSKARVAQSLRRLRERGFILRGRNPLPDSASSAPRTIYQRPAVEFTLIMLLKQSFIDAEFYPIELDPEGKTLSGARPEETYDPTESAVRLGLRSLIGEAGVRSCLIAGAARKDVLLTLLQQRLERKIYVAQNRARGRSTTPTNGSWNRILDENAEIAASPKRQKGIEDAQQLLARAEAAAASTDDPVERERYLQAVQEQNARLKGWAEAPRRDS